jgi:protein-S-isoprenylcysteine O-methyltransferase Ste14
MGRQAALVLYVVTLIAVVVGADVLFFRHNFWPRLMANVGIVLLFGAFYLRYLSAHDGMRANASTESSG